MNRFLTLAIAAPLLALSLLQGGAVLAQGDTARLGDLVVTATRVPTPESSIPAGVTVLRGDDLRARGIAEVLEALRDVPGITVVQGGSFGALTSVFMRGGNSDYVKVLLDGVPLNVPGGSINFANLTTADLDRIEIVRGPVSVLYGADAMSGVIQLFTRHAGGRTNIDVAADGGTFGMSNTNAHLGVTGGKWSLSATGARDNTDGTYAFNSGFQNSVGSAQAGYDDGGRGHASLTVRYGDGVAHFPTDGNGVPVDHNQFSTEHSLALGLDLAKALSPGTSLHVQGFASRLLEGFTNRSDTPADTNGFDFIEDRGDVTWRRGFDLRVDTHLRPQTVLSIGTGVEHETDVASDIGASNFGFGAETDTTALDASRTTDNVYGQLLAAPSPGLTLQLGARLDHNSAFGNFGTWRAGATMHLSRTSRIWAGAGTAFKAPTFSELFASSAFEVGNPNLKPERTSNIEVGLETAVSRRITVGATAFWQQFHDQIQFVGADPGDPNYQNLAAASARGVEATATGNLSARVTFNAHWTWLHTEVTDTGAASSVSSEEGESLIRRPGSMGGATLTWRLRGWFLSGTVTHVGSRDDVDFSGATAERVILPGYTTVDAGADIPLSRSGRAAGIDLTFRGENLFDTTYLQTVGYPGHRRTLLAGGRLHF